MDPMREQKKTTKRSLAGRIWIWCMLRIAYSFPLNRIRVNALRACGFSIGKEVYIGPGLMLSTMNSDNSCELRIHDRVSIGPRVTLVLASHCNHSRLGSAFPPVKGSITIEEDAWIGAGVIILPNVTIGMMTAIAAGSVVNRSIGSDLLAGGTPAKIIRNLK